MKNEKNNSILESALRKKKKHTPGYEASNFVTNIFSWGLMTVNCLLHS